MPLYSGCTKRIKLNLRIFCSVEGLTHSEMKRKRNRKVWLSKYTKIKRLDFYYQLIYGNYFSDLG